MATTINNSSSEKPRLVFIEPPCSTAVCKPLTTTSSFNEHVRNAVEARNDKLRHRMSHVKSFILTK